MRVAITLALLGGMAFGQGFHGAITGRVEDASGTAAPQTFIRAVHSATGVMRDTRVNEAGEYVLAGLPAGAYTVEASREGFAPVRREGVVVATAETARVDFQIRPGRRDESITVTAPAPAVRTEPAALGDTIANREVLALPLNGRNYLSLALLAPGVAPAVAGANPHHIGGARSDHANYLLDGIANVDRRGNQPLVQPPLEAIEEFTVVTSSAAPEHGRLGAGVVSVALRSGSNQVHGTVFHFLRNDAFDARGFFDPAPPVLRRNQFGATLSGPLRRDRTFFMGAWESLRNRERLTRLGRVPAASERAGILPGVTDPATGTAFPESRIPESRIDPVARRLLDYWPEPNRSGAINYVATRPSVQDNDSFAFKADHRAGERGQWSGHVLLNDGRSQNPFRATGIPGFGSAGGLRSQRWGTHYTHVLGPAATLEARAAFARSSLQETGVNAGRSGAVEAGIAGVPEGSGLTAIAVAGFAAIGDPTALPDRWTDNEFLASATAGAMRGRHWLRFGGDFQRSQHFNLFAAFANGQLQFSGARSRAPFGDFLLGLPVQSQRQVGSNKSYLFGATFGVFAQDQFRLTPRLTLSYGVRYEATLPPQEKFGRIANFLPELGRVIVPGDPGYSARLMRTDWNNLAPRLGVAYRMGRTVVRAGYGIYHSFDLQFTLYQLLGATAAPFTRLELYQASAAVPLSLARPFPAAPSVNPGALSPNGWEYANPSPYQHQWNVAVARELAGAMGVEAAYVGARATHLSAMLNLNQTIRTPAGPVQPYPGLGRVLWQSLGANSHYESLQMSVRRRLARGFAARSSFTWSKSIDNASFASAQRLPQNSRDLRNERGLSEFHRALVWSNDFVWRLPGRGALGNWQLSGIVQAASGTPFTPSIAAANTQAGEPTRPDRIGSGALPEPSVERWFDVSSFRVPARTEFRYGNSGRNILTGPGRFQIDAALGKRFRLRSDRGAVEFRAEAFNLANRANFGLPATAVDQPTAGAIASADPGRRLQFALKLIF